MIRFFLIILIFLSSISILKAEQTGENLFELSKSKIQKKARSHSLSTICIKKPFNNILKIEFTKKCENGFQFKKKNNKDFWKFKDDNKFLDGKSIFPFPLSSSYVYYYESPISYQLIAFTRNFDLLSKFTNDFEDYRNFTTLKNQIINFSILSAKEIEDRNIINQKKIFVCRRLSDYKKIVFKTSGSSKEGILLANVPDVYATNGECEKGFESYVLKKGSNYYDIFLIKKKDFIKKINNFSETIYTTNTTKFSGMEIIKYANYFYIFIDVLSEVKTDIAKQEKISPEKEKTEEEKKIIAEINQELAEKNTLTNKPKITIKNKDVTEWEKKILKAELFEKQNPSKCKETKTLVSKSYCIKKSDFLKLGEYKEIKDFPAGFVDSLVGCKSTSCINQNSGKKVYKIFVQRGEQYHTRYPGAIIQGMVWFELLYFKRLKSSRFLDEFTYYNFEQPISGRKGKALLSLINMNNGRIKMRQALGYSLYDKTEDVIAAQWLLGEFMNKDKLKTVKNKSFTSDFEKRKELLDKYKDALARFNKKLKEKKNEAQN